MTLRTHDRERCVNLFGYLASLWEYCGLQVKEHSTWHYYLKPLGEDEMGQCGPQHYAGYLAHLHGYKELQSQIAAIQAIAPEENAA